MDNVVGPSSDRAMILSSSINDTDNDKNSKRKNSSLDVSPIIIDEPWPRYLNDTDTVITEQPTTSSSRIGSGPDFGVGDAQHRMVVDTGDTTAGASNNCCADVCGCAAAKPDTDCINGLLTACCCCALCADATGDCSRGCFDGCAAAGFCCEHCSS